MKIFICETCNVEFESIKGCKNRVPKYCSRKCYAERIMKQETIERMSKARIGKEPWNKGVNMWKWKEHPRGTLGMKFIGRKVSEETKKKMSISQKGKPRENMRGENSHFWKGGITNENEKIRKSLEYRNWRRGVFERDNYKCIICGINSKNLEADHIKPFCLYKELRFEIDNGRTLCKECHKNTETYGGKIQRYMIKLDPTLNIKRNGQPYEITTQ